MRQRVMDAICGHDELDCTSQQVKADFRAACKQDVAGMRVGIVKEFMEADGLTEEVRERTLEAAAKLKAAGAELVEVELPHVDAAISAYYVLGPCEAFSNLARFDSVRYGLCDEGHKDLGGQYESSRAKGFGPEAKRRIMLGSYLLSAGVYEKYYYPAQQVRTLITQDYTSCLREMRRHSRTCEPAYRVQVRRDSAIRTRCTCLTCSRCRSISPVTAA